MSPRVSVIVPAYYSHATVAECLEALRGQTLRDFETILVNSSPEEETGRIVTSRFPEVTFEQSPRRLLPHAARNRGVARARGDLLVFTDPDCRARPDWLERIVAAWEAGREVVGGAMGLAGGGWLERAIHLAKFSWLLPGAAAGPRRVVCTANAAYSRRAFERVGPFDEDIFIGDAALCMRACAAGLEPWFEPRAVVEHHHEGPFAGYVREFYLRGREMAEVRRRQLGWGRARGAAHAAALPAVVALEIARTGRNAASGGWGAAWVATLPAHAAFRVAWLAGEAAAGLRGARPGAGPPGAGA